MRPDSIISSLRNKEFTDTVLAEALELMGEAQYQLFELARQARHAAFQDDGVHVRSVLEISNVWRQMCRYCAIGGNANRPFQGYFGNGKFENRQIDLNDG